MKARLFYTTAAIALGTPVLAVAQQAASGGLEEIVVTAQRRQELLENVPMAITVLNPETVAKAGVTSFMDLGKVATGVKMDFSGSVPTVAIRGITSQTTGYNFEPNVAVYIDGFYEPQVITMDSDMANLDSIEVLKGPQGTLYGRNATGGAILINTRGPSKTFTGQIEGGYGRFNDKMANAYMAGPINDRIRVSVSGHYRENDGYIKLISPTNANQTVSDSALPYKQGQFRAKVEADITDDITALVGFNYGYTGDNRANTYGQVGHVSPLILGFVHPTAFDTTAYDYKPDNQGRTYEETLKLTWKTAIGTLTSYTGYADRYVKIKFDFDQTYQPVSANVIKYDQHTFQEAVDYSITAIKNLDLVVGGLYYNDRFQHRPGWGTESFSFGTLLFRQFQVQPTDSWAAYVDGTYHLTDKLSLTAGGRYSSDWRRSTWTVYSGTGAITLPTISGEHRWNKFTPRVTARYELADRTDVYASYSKGFHSGIYNGAPPTAPGQIPVPAAPETVDAYEIGFKTAQAMFRFQSSAFYYNYTNFQVSLVVPNVCPTGVAAGTCGVSAILQNAPSAHVYGWDNELTITPVQHLTFRAGLELLHGRYGSFPNAAGVGVNAANTANVSGQIQDWTHLQMVRAPNWSGNAAIDYEVPSSIGTFLFTTSLTFTGTYPIQNPSVYGPLASADLQNKQRFLQTSMALLGAQVTWTDPKDRYYITAYGNNLTDHVYRLSYNGASFGDYSAMAEPLTYGVKVGVKFR